MLQAGPAARERALDEVAALGADGVRALVLVARRRAGAGSAAAPGRLRSPPTRAHTPPRAGTRSTTSCAARACAGSRCCSRPRRRPRRGRRAAAARCALRSVCSPRPRQYGAFVRALSAHSSGAYADENQGRGVLPRVERWSFGNEPNQPSWLRPQFARRRRRPVYCGRGGHLPRHGAGGDPARCAPPGTAATRPLLGETSPIGRVTGRLATPARAAGEVHPDAAVHRPSRPGRLRGTCGPG